MNHTDSGESSDGDVGATVGEAESPDHPAAEVEHDLLPDMSVACNVVVTVLLEAVENAFAVGLVKERRALREVLDKDQREARDDDNDDS